MRIHTLDAEVIAPGSLEDVFRFFQDPANLARITPPSMGFQIVSTDRNMRRGLEIEYRVRVFGLNLPWKSLISAYNPPHMFVDEALVSRYQLWRHRHEFRETTRGTVVTDHVDYALPMSAPGEIAHPMVRAQLNQIFSFRQKALELHLGKLIDASGPVIR